MCKPNNELANVALVFDIQGIVVEHPLTLPLPDDNGMPGVGDNIQEV